MAAVCTGNGRLRGMRCIFCRYQDSKRNGHNMNHYTTVYTTAFNWKAIKGVVHLFTDPWMLLIA